MTEKLPQDRLNTKVYRDFLNAVIEGSLIESQGVLLFVALEQLRWARCQGWVTNKKMM